MTVAPTKSRRSGRSQVGPDGLLEVRPSADYNEAERAYSSLLYQRLDQLLGGRRNRLLLLRKYPAEPNRLGIMPTPDALKRERLRLPVVEKLGTDALIFLSVDSQGGPVVQQSDGNGRLIETRTFPTKFPHIVIERRDTYQVDGGSTESVEWSARRVQNQRSSVMINRMLDAANLGLDVAKLFF